MGKLFGIDLVCVAIDDKTEEDFKGSIFTQYSESAVKFDSSKDMLNKLDEIYDDWGFPEASDKARSFIARRPAGNQRSMPMDPKKRLVNMAKERKPRDISGEKGKKASFYVLTEMRQHASWQGRAIWIEKDKEIEFKSALELLFFIDDALNTV
ncbi:hypothetical protein [Oribacterium sp. C9]|uniref:hypothetical protein n=1 Tax=Oribacterium sp. C9 TaxID=1943579 RepID=UPI00098F84B8|nr:hypothetical protein [Oribacterium sp. C9]